MSRTRLSRAPLLRVLALALLVSVSLTPAASGSRRDARGLDRWSIAPTQTAVVGYRSTAALRRTVREHGALVVRTIPALHVAEVRPRSQPRYFAAGAQSQPGIDYVEPTVRRSEEAEPALEPSSGGLPLEWQYAAARVNDVPPAVLQAASAFTIAVIDTGADLHAPDIAAKAPVTYSVVSGSSGVRDAVGHGTFVTALAGGSDTNGDGIAGFGGDAKLMVVQASRTTAAFSDFDEAAAIVWAVDHGARIVNLSLGGPDTSTTERRAVDYAVKHGALVVAAVGNERDSDNPVEYPAALVQPVGSDGRGGVGLSVGASDQSGRPADFSNTGSHLSLLAPGVSVLSALSTTGSNVGYVPTTVPGASGRYAFASGTSFAAPEVSGAAALVWAANPGLNAQQVAAILKQTATGGGSWTADAGYGVLDVAAAVERASGTSGADAPQAPRLTLTATPVRGRGPLTVSLRATLAPAAAGRMLSFEAYGGGGWQPSAAAQTDAAGSVLWRLRLQPGRYRLRVRAGATVSRPVTVTISA